MRSSRVHPTDDLARSYLDLRRHFDPAEAARAGVGGSQARLGEFDAAAVREHLAALRSVEAAIEELDLTSAGDEIDRTALLDDIRAMMFRLAGERPGARNPAWWLVHLGRSLDDTDDAEALLARLRAVPAFLEAAAAELDEPAGPFVDLARELAEPVAGLITAALHHHGADSGLLEAARAAESAIARFRLLLDTELAERGREHHAGAGTEHLDHLLHHQHALRAGAAELGRHILGLEETAIADLEATAADLGGDWRAMLEERLEATDLGGALVAEGNLALDRLAGVVRGLGVFPPVTDLPQVSLMPDWVQHFTWPAEYVAAAGLEADGQLLLADDRWTRVLLEPLLAELAVPGVHLHVRQAQQQSSEVRRTVNPLLWGGWGLYALDLLLQEGVWATPDERLPAQVLLLYRLLLGRIDVGVHAHLMSVADAEALLIERLGLEAGAARAAVRGVLLHPTQAAGAVAGWEELCRLSEEAAATSRSALAAFHQRLARFGGLPVPLARWGLEADLNEEC